jgi:hypothetical protein
MVAVAGWVLPGAGYWLIGQKSRALTVGITIIILFVLGLLIAGMRVIDVPGFDANGQMMMVDVGLPQKHWVMAVDPLSELRNKPWSVPQLLTGPIGVLAGWESVRWSRPDASGNPIAPQSHVRINEIGSLYCSVAGLLNLMVIIDAAARAARGETPEEAEAE